MGNQKPPQEGGQQSNTDRKATFRVTHCNGKERRPRERGREKADVTCYMGGPKEGILKQFFVCLVQFLHKKPPKPGSEHHLHRRSQHSGCRRDSRKRR